jgi:hypothetical protein
MGDDVASPSSNKVSTTVRSQCPDCDSAPPDTWLPRSTPVVGQTCHINGWDEVLPSEGTHFMNHSTGHGMFVSIVYFEIPAWHPAQTH